MRLVCLLFLVVIAAGAQEHAKGPVVPGPPASPPAPAAPPTPCAVPLLNAGRLPHPEPMPRVRPPAGSRFFIRQIHPPAPACTSFKNGWRSGPPPNRP